jgi:23S rRNA (uracil1939-C5)-methyltransferase
MARKRSRRKPVPEGLHDARIEALSSDARGIARIDGKTTFIEGALPEEQVTFRYTRSKASYDEGVLEDVVEHSEHRVTPRCEYHLVCGGCSLQHLSSESQIALKQKILHDNLRQIGQVIPDETLEPITGEQWGYRRKARLGVRDVKAKGRVLVGFREKSNRYLADIHSCEVLHQSVGQRIDELSDLIGSLHGRLDIAQIEVAVSDDATALVFRNMQALDEHDLQLLTKFARKFDYCIYLQPGNIESIQPLWPESPRLAYSLADHDVVMEFLPGDFTQVNASVNSLMVERAIEQLQLQQDDTVLDLFCGLGNFTLPIARQAGFVIGVEGDQGLVQRAQWNAENNKIKNVSFHTADLFEEMDPQILRHRKVNKLLLDPPRSGAQAVVEQVERIDPERIVYVSCHTATLARDAGILSHKGYRLVKAGVMDMFPHTMHVESMAVFIRN